MPSFLEQYTLLADPIVLAAAALSVALVGLSKGGLGGAFALMGVPVLALTMPPMQAAALLLPSYLIMDAVGLYTWRGFYRLSTLKVMIPAAIVGITFGWATATIVSSNQVKVLVGLIGLVFTLRQTHLALRKSPLTHHRENSVRGSIWGAIAGFTSFVAHSGGPPYQVYTLPLGMNPKLFTGTSVIFFAVVNAVKVIPYLALGAMDERAFYSAIVLLPIAVVFTLLGAYAIKRISIRVFYPFMYLMVLMVSIKLIIDGLSSI